MSNIPSNIESKRKLKYHNKLGHPICLIKQKIYNHFKSLKIPFKMFDDLDEVVDTINNFDLLLISNSHPSRSKSDTYYIDDTHVLRTHTSAHQNFLLSEGEYHFLVTGDVYRKDEVDKFHYPVFHQMEGVHIVDDDIDPEEDLKLTLSGLVEYLFPGKLYRFNNDYFPFTVPSFEIEVLLGTKWVEILGCGVIHNDILKHNNITKKGWAFGLGLERLAMIFYSIPDIRLFWTTDERFINQFNSHTCDDEITFLQYPKLEKRYKDISFWLDPSDCEITDGKLVKWTRQNDFFDVIRSCFDGNVEEVEKFDEFFHPKIKKYSNAWRIWLSPDNELSDPAIFNSECNEQMEKLRLMLIEELKLELR